MVKSKEIKATKFISQGRGPNEVLAPTLLNKSMYNRQGAIYILDTNLKTLVITDTTGREIQRYSNKNIPNSITANKMYISNDNSFIWPSYNNQDYVLAEWDSLGNLKKKLAKRLIKQGKQPESHNTIIFDLEPNEDILSYSYIGIPLIFVEEKGQKKVINLFPDKEIEEFNIGLEELPYEKNTRVNRIIRSVDFVEDIILVSTKEFLYIIPNSFDKKIKTIKLLDSKGSKIIYHNLKVTTENIYFINLYNQNINKVNLENFLEFYSK